jgi:hypothetical protein
VFKLRGTLVALDRRASQDQQILQISGSEKVLRELIFSGDTARHVF